MNSIEFCQTLFEPSFTLTPIEDPPAEPTRSAMIACVPSTRAQFVQNLTIFSDGLLQGDAVIGSSLSRGGSQTAPGGSITIGEGGTGKSFILERQMRRYPPRFGDLRSFVPVLHIKLKERPAPDDVQYAILDALRYGGNSRRLSPNEREETVKLAMTACGTRGLLIDEAHHLYLIGGSRKNPDRQAGPVGDYLISLYDETRIAQHFFGTPTLGKLFEKDRQLSTRWPGVIYLAKYLLDESWIVLLDTLDKALPMHERCKLAERDQPEKIYRFTQGNFRQLKGFLAEAVRLAAVDGAPKLTDQHFCRAYFLLGYPPSKNPWGAVYE